MYTALRPLLFALPAETAHDLTLLLLRLAQRVALPLVRLLGARPAACLQQELWGLTFPGPVGLAAGLDKNAALVPLFRALGFGAVEVGSVTARPALGNPRPRVFRLPADRALINRMGLPNVGAAAVAARLRGAGLLQRGLAPLGINVAKTHDPAILGTDAVADLCQSYQVLAPLCDYLVLNVSCPNTKDGRTFEEPDALDGLLQAVRGPAPRGPSVPLLLKLAPPPEDAVSDAGRLRPEHRCAGRLAEILAVARAHDIRGLVLGNTAPDRPSDLRTARARLTAVGAGGLSGPPLAPRHLALLRHCYRATRAQGWTPVLIGTGGVDSAAAAYQRLRAGASLVQLYTALIYEGPGLLGRIYQGLERALERDGYARLSDAVGSQV